MSDCSAKVAVVGAGAWGTALTWMLGGKGLPVCLWARRSELAAEITARRENTAYLPGTTVPDSVTATADMALALENARTVVIALPSHALRAVVRTMAPHLASGRLLICATKGIERETTARMSEILYEELAALAPVVVALSGPNLSAEIAGGTPAVSVVASADHEAARQAQQLLANPLFRVYTNSDIMGVELCGALKNVIAIAAGISDGLGFGDNAKAALITRGLAEIRRLGLRLGACAETFSGIAGMGDLIATCNSPLSRNWTVGSRLAQGEAYESILQSMHQVAEGVYTTEAAVDMAGRYGVETPIAETLYRVLYQGLSPGDGVRELMARRWRAEEE